MGFYISFWGFGYGILSGLKKEDPEAPSPMLKVDKVRLDEERSDEL